MLFLEPILKLYSFFFSPHMVTMEIYALQKQKMFEF